MFEQRSSWLYRVSILALSMEWLGFGACHFLLRADTEAQIPDIFPFKTFIAVATGMVEVTTGILILFPRTRKWAAISSLVLLTIFLPSIYRLMTHGEIIRGSAEFRHIAQAVLLPNHVFLALCAIYLLRWAERPAPGESARVSLA
jgi:uncharacterized membrane protein